MMRLDPDECRVLGVLVEKALTTSDQYPLSINSLVNGCSQKSNRNPVQDYDEPRVYEAVDRLRGKGIVIEAHLSGSRVVRFRHNAREVLSIDTPQLVVLVELLLRGPQTMGELRGRVSRMRPIESIEQVRNILESLMQRDQPFVQQISSVPSSRSPHYGQLLCPDLHPVAEEVPVRANLSGVELSRAGASVTNQAAPAADTALTERVDRLEDEIVQLRQALAKLAASLGEGDLP